MTPVKAGFSATSFTLQERNPLFCAGPRFAWFKRRLDSAPALPWQGSWRDHNTPDLAVSTHMVQKEADLSRHSQSDLDEIALRLNQRPRKTLGFQTPADKLQHRQSSWHAFGRHDNKGLVRIGGSGCSIYHWCEGSKRAPI